MACIRQEKIGLGSGLFAYRSSGLTGSNLVDFTTNTFANEALPVCAEAELYSPIIDIAKGVDHSSRSFFDYVTGQCWQGSWGQRECVRRKACQCCSYQNNVGRGQPTYIWSLSHLLRDALGLGHKLQERVKVHFVALHPHGKSIISGMICKSGFFYTGKMVWDAMPLRKRRQYIHVCMQEQIYGWKGQKESAFSTLVCQQLYAVVVRKSLCPSWGASRISICSCLDITVDSCLTESCGVSYVILNSSNVLSVSKVSGVIASYLIFMASLQTPFCNIHMLREQVDLAFLVYPLLNAYSICHHMSIFLFSSEERNFVLNTTLQGRFAVKMHWNGFSHGTRRFLTLRISFRVLVQLFVVKEGGYVVDRFISRLDLVIHMLLRDYTIMSFALYVD
ncbi:unnamed protein product [Thelazia callipaeda]|uniref:Pecanex-like protein n=1 Tax=Thelazia callipaeda TaxID=103827 RepID=A0A0N5CYN7_THECL|nr:unnamed protein product [Thelazia callipaeda]